MPGVSSEAGEPGPSTPPPPTPAQRGGLRASDADREAVADQLREACGQGRLTYEELGERVEAGYSARTLGELEVLVADLPGAVPGSAPLAEPGSGDRSYMVAVLGDSKRTGRWRVEGPITAVAVLGDCRIDLRSAVIPTRTVRIDAVAVLGDVLVLVPPGVDVELTGVALLGDKVLRLDPADRTVPGLLTVRVHATAVLGDVKVVTETKLERWRRTRAQRRGELES